MTPSPRRTQSGSVVLAGIAGMVLLGIALMAASAALGWTRSPAPLASWALWTIAAGCGLLSLFLLIGLDVPGMDDPTPDDLAARGDFTDPGRLAGFAGTARTASSTVRADTPEQTSGLPWRPLLALLLVSTFLWQTGVLREAYHLAAPFISAALQTTPPQARQPQKTAPPAASSQRPSPAPAPAPAPNKEPSRPAAPLNCDEASLHQAVAAPCIARLEQLLTAGPQLVELRDPNGLTPLATAVLADRLESAELLLKARANVDNSVRFRPGTAPRVGGLEKSQSPQLAEFSTPLIMAKSASMATLLLRHGADPKLKNDYGWSAIFYFTRNGNPDMIDILIAGGADINDTANVDPFHAGSTPLMWAAFMNLLPQLDALLKHRPRLDIRDRAGNTALDYATRLKHPEAVARLKAAAAAR